MCNGHTMTDHNDDDQRWLETVLKGLDERSEAVKQALMEAVAGREGAGPLLGFETTDTENTQENADKTAQPDHGEAIFPLLGTNSLKSLDKLYRARSSERVCYESLLRFGAHSSCLNIGKTVKNGPRGCYGFN